MITFRDLNGKEVLRTTLDDGRAFRDVQDKLKDLSSQPLRLYFMDQERDVAEVVDQDDWEYALFQSAGSLVVAVVDRSEELKGVALMEAVQRAIDGAAAGEQSPVDAKAKAQPQEGQKTSVMSPDEPLQPLEPAKQTPKSDPSPTSPSELVAPADAQTPQPEAPQKVQELSQILIQLEQTVQNNIKELASSLSPSSPKPQPLPPSSPVIGKNRPFSGQKPLPNCSHCHQAVQGKRFKCLLCADFTLCATCEICVSHPHTMIRFTDGGQEAPSDQLGRVYQLKHRLTELSDDDMRRAVIRRVTNSQYPEEFYEQFVRKNAKLGFGEFVNKVVGIFE